MPLLGADTIRAATMFRPFIKPQRCAIWAAPQLCHLLGLSSARLQAVPLLGADTIRAATIFCPFAKPSEVRHVGLRPTCAICPAARQTVWIGGQRALIHMRISAAQT